MKLSSFRVFFIFSFPRPVLKIRDIYFELDIKQAIIQLNNTYFIRTRNNTIKSEFRIQKKYVKL